MKKEILLHDATAASNELDTLYATIEAANELTNNQFLEDVFGRILDMLDKEQASLGNLIADLRKSISKE